LATLPWRLVNPSTFLRLGTWWGSIPRIPSNEWFSIMSTTMCRIFSMLDVPAGR
jgi:hypothetical protein